MQDDRGDAASGTMAVNGAGTVKEEEEEDALVVGDEVRHETFGEGLVLAVEAGKAEVDFERHGTRTIRLDFLTRLDG
jgi:hypothetical protein